MDSTLAVELARRTLLAALATAAPLLAVVLVVSLLIAIVQTVFNLQEQTLTVVPKIVTALLTTVALAPWILRALTDFALQLLRDVLPQRM